MDQHATPMMSTLELARLFSVSSPAFFGGSFVLAKKGVKTWPVCCA